MLHIVLAILKIIGIILAAVLGILLCLLLVILFVPIRYEGSGIKTEEQIKAEASVSWLLKAFCVKLRLLDKDFQYEIRIFGISLEQIQRFFEKLKKKKVTEKEGELPKEKIAEPETAKEEVPKEEIPKAEIPKTEISKTEIPKTEKKVKKKEEKTKEVPSVPEKKKESIWRIPGKILSAFKKMQLTIKGICDKIKYWLDFLHEEHTKGSIALIKIQLIKVLKHILPRKLKGNILFGFEDPSKTGQILAGICMFYPFYYKKLNISPDFTQAILLGDIEIKGRIYLAYFVKTAIRVFFDKNIQYVWKKLKK